LARWDETPGLAFPPAIKIRNRKYRDAAQLDAWDVENSRRAAAMNSNTRRGLA